MILESVRIRSFRNLHAVDLEPGPGLNTLSGDNGQGKTAFLEALGFLAEGRSFRSTVPASLVTESTSALNVRGLVRSGRGGLSEIEVGFGRVGAERGRKITHDGRRLDGLAEHLGVLRVVIHSPEDLNLISGSPEMRRKFLNRILVLLDGANFERLKDYGRIVRNRNHLLRCGRSRAEVEPWTEQLVRVGAELLEARLRLVEDLAPRVDRVHRNLAGDKGAAIEISYKCAAGELGAGTTVADAAARLRAVADAKFGRELEMGRTLVGPQLDDLSVTMRASSAKLHASQGERRTSLIAMRLAERELLAERTGETPVFLVDDLSSELDRGRTARVLEMVEELDGQVFLTGTEERLAHRPSTRSFDVREGVITERGAGLRVERASTA